MMLIFTKQEENSFIRKSLCSKLPRAAIPDKFSAKFPICSLLATALPWKRDETPSPAQVPKSRWWDYGAWGNKLLKI
jgi:hypothetical protein